MLHTLTARNHVHHDAHVGTCRRGVSETVARARHIPTFRVLRRRMALVWPLCDIHGTWLGRPNGFWSGPVCVFPVRKRTSRTQWPSWSARAAFQEANPRPQNAGKRRGMAAVSVLLPSDDVDSGVTSQMHANGSSSWLVRQQQWCRCHVVATHPAGRHSHGACSKGRQAIHNVLRRTPPTFGCARRGTLAALDRGGVCKLLAGQWSWSGNRATRPGLFRLGVEGECSQAIAGTVANVTMKQS
jgi:hypothetical protein